MILTHHGINSLQRDPQEYDYTDVPEGTVFPDRVPMDTPKWEESMPFLREQNAILIDDSASWSESCASGSEQEAILISDQQTWSESVVLMGEYDVS